MSFRLLFVLAFVVAIGCGSPREPSPVAEESLPPSGERVAAAGKTAHEPDGASEAASIPDVVARIGDRSITRTAYLAELDTKQRQLDAEMTVLRETTRRDLPAQPLSPLARQEILDNLVAKVLLQELAAKGGYEASDAEIDARLAEGQENLADSERYQEYLEWYNITEEQLRQQIRDQVLTEKYLAEQIEPCEITDGDVRVKFEELEAANQLEGPAEVDFRHILLMVPPGSPETAWDTRKEEMVNLRERVTGGEDFAEVAIESSDDPSAPRNAGLYEFIQREMMVPPVDEYLFTGPLDEVSEPIQTSYGWHIVRIEDRREEGPRTYEQVEARLRESLAVNCDARRAKEFVEAKMIEHDAEILYEVEGAAAQRAAMEREAAEREAHMEADSAAEVSDEADEEGEPEATAP